MSKTIMMGFGVVTAAVLALGGFTVPAMAEQGQAHMAPPVAPYARPMPQRRDMAAELELSEQQRAKVQELMGKQREMMRQQMEAIRADQEKMRTLYQAETWDAKAIREAQDKIHAKRMAMMEEMVKTRNEIHGLLNEQQRERFKNMVAPQMMDAPQQ